MSLRKAINDKCRDCIFDPANRGNWREQVSMCPILDCPLWNTRPVSSKWGKLGILHDEQKMKEYRGYSVEQLYKELNLLSEEVKP